MPVKFTVDELGTNVPLLVKSPASVSVCEAASRSASVSMVRLFTDVSPVNVATAELPLAIRRSL